MKNKEIQLSSYEDSKLLLRIEPYKYRLTDEIFGKEIKKSKINFGTKYIRIDFRTFIADYLLNSFDIKELLFCYELYFKDNYIIRDNEKELKNKLKYRKEKLKDILKNNTVDKYIKIYYEFIRNTNRKESSNPENKITKLFEKTFEDDTFLENNIEYMELITIFKTKNDLLNEMTIV